jgi:SAM-dependent methyltransferase
MKKISKNLSSEIMEDQVHRKFEEFSSFLKTISKKNLSEYKEKFFEQIDIISETINQSPNRKELEEEFFQICSGIDKSLMHKRTREKPLGYAGDFQLIDWIYTQKTTTNGKGKLFDLLFHSYEAAQSVRNRKEYFKNKCLSLANNKKKQINILNLGCGSCRDVLETFQESTNGCKLFFHCIDHEPKAITSAKKLLSHNKAHDNVLLETTNVFHIHTDKKYDLIWSAGLFDYLEDRVVVLLLKKMWRYLKEGGKIIFGNFSQNNPTRNGMELVGKWYLIHRSAEELIRLCTEAKIPFREIEIESEPNGINLFCNITK